MHKLRGEGYVKIVVIVERRTLGWGKVKHHRRRLIGWDKVGFRLR